MQRLTLGHPWQVRQTALEIDLGRLKRNYLRLAERARGADLLALLKSDAYGHGFSSIAKSLEALPPSSRLHGYGVANVEEGIELRKIGVKRPIYVLSGIQNYDSDLHRCLQTVRLTPVISSMRTLRDLVKVAGSGSSPWKVHLKFNTGMNRLGIEPMELPDCLKILGKVRGIEVHGIMSHFAAGEKPSSETTKKQVREFRSLVERLRDQGIHPRYLHMANSSGLASHLYPEGNLVRVGIHLYGMDDPDLQPVARWVAQVYQVRDLKKGDGVGYGPHFRAKRKMKMAVLGVGYGDGYRRAYSNKAQVLLRGRRCPVIGAVSMDLTAVDISSAPSVGPRDLAVLLGKDGQDRITAAELAGHAGTISWEVLTAISSRVPRVFINE